MYMKISYIYIYANVVPTLIPGQICSLQFLKVNWIRIKLTYNIAIACLPETTYIGSINICVMKLIKICPLILKKCSWREKSVRDVNPNSHDLALILVYGSGSEIQEQHYLLLKMASSTAHSWNSATESVYVQVQKRAREEKLKGFEVLGFATTLKGCR